MKTNIDPFRLITPPSNVPWGGVSLPAEYSTTHFVVIGAPGSGKTVTINQILWKVIPKLGKVQDRRAVVYDAKQDVLSLLYKIAPPGVNVRILNPFDKRSVAWDMAKDIVKHSTALQVASILIPEKNESQPFFSNAARALLSGCMIALMHIAGNRWQLRDVILTLKNRERLESVLKKCKYTRDLVSLYINDTQAFVGVMSTIANKIVLFEPIAACWARCKESISLTEWSKSGDILVLGNDEENLFTIDALNQVIFKRLSEIILKQTETKTRRNWFILDEIKTAGKLEGLPRLLTKGRSKGVCVVMGLQDIEGLRHVYGKETANEIVGQCSQKAILRLECPVTAKWVSEALGEFEQYELKETVTTGENSTSFSETYERQKREPYLSSELLSIPPVDRGTGLFGIYLAPKGGLWSYQTPMADFPSETSDEDKKTTPDFEPRSARDELLEPWSEEDYKRLRLKPSSVKKRRFNIWCG